MVQPKVRLKYQFKIRRFESKGTTDMNYNQGSAWFFLKNSRDSLRAISLAVPGRILEQVLIETPGEMGKNVPK